MVPDFDFEDLVGEELDFHGVDGQRFRLDDVTYEVIENEQGDYRVEVSDKPIEGLPIARVTIGHAPFSDVSFELTDLHDGHAWLSFGANYESYACGEDAEFYFDYTPKDIEYV